MKKNDIRVKYRTYGYRSNVPLVSREQQWKSYFDGKFGGIDVDVDIDTSGITESITNLGEKMDTKFCEIHHHLDDVKCHLCCDICCAKKDIKKHIDTKFTEVNFERKFSDLNAQVEQILSKLE